MTGKDASARSQGGFNSHLEYPTHQINREQFLGIRKFLGVDGWSLTDVVNAVGAGFTAHVTVFGNNVSKPAPSPPQSGKKIIREQITGKTRSHVLRMGKI